MEKSHPWPEEQEESLSNREGQLRLRPLALSSPSSPSSSIVNNPDQLGCWLKVVTCAYCPILFFFSAGCLMVSVMVFDAPQSHKSVAPWMGLFVFWSLPPLLTWPMIAMWRQFYSEHYLLAFRIISYFPASLMMLLAVCYAAVLLIRPLQ